ncbi:MAG: hypothetical protein E7179_02785 [Erysipelotrichaceae bacterium]|jgi:hypothetical protein|nr:hypothetical protein [Erysipelotrichaceae bacterium]
MILRNRLIALLFRAGSFALLAYLTSVYSAENGYFWRALSFFDLEVAAVFLLIFGLEVVFNLVDMRKGIHGVPSHFYAPIAIPVVIMNAVSSLIFFFYGWPSGSASGSVGSVFFHAFFLVIPVVNWVLFYTKGTVRWFTSFSILIVPTFYALFSFFRTLIWPDSTVYGAGMYAYPFLNPEDALYPLHLIGFLFGFFGAAILVIFLNNLMAGKYKNGLRDPEY